MRLPFSAINLYCNRGHYRTTNTFWTSAKGRRSCKYCRNINSYKWTRSSKYYLKFYGIDKVEWTKLFNQQKGCCAICGIHQISLKANLSVDHDHITKQIRGLLCRSCNLMIGNAQDNPSILQRGIVYLMTAAKVV